MPKSTLPNTGRTLTNDTPTKSKDVQAPNVIQEQGEFVYPTGDVYDGYFEAKNKDRSVKMHGPGTYISAQGDRYTGLWENDKLINSEYMQARYPDGSKYEGTLTNWKYTGDGVFVYPDGTELACEYAENCPVGELTLTDPNGHVWLGRAQSGFAWLGPVNHYYDALEQKKEVKSRSRK